MRQQYTFECGCGATHTAATTAKPVGWQIDRTGKPHCSDCVSAKNARGQRRAA